MIANNAARLLRPVSKSLVPRRTFEASSVVSGPPTVHVSGAEKAITGLVMVSGWTFVPIWVLLHIKDYKGQ